MPTPHRRHLQEDILELRSLFRPPSRLLRAPACRFGSAYSGPTPTCGRVSVTATSLELQSATAPRSFSTSLPSSRDRGRGPFKWQRRSRSPALCTRRAGGVSNQPHWLAQGGGSRDSAGPRRETPSPMDAWKLRSGTSALEMELEPPPGAPLVEEKLASGAWKPAPGEGGTPFSTKGPSTLTHKKQIYAPASLTWLKSLAPRQHPCPPYLLEPTLPVIPSSHSNGSRSPPPPRVSPRFPLVFNPPASAPLNSPYLRHAAGACQDYPPPNPTSPEPAPWATAGVMSDSGGWGEAGTQPSRAPPPPLVCSLGPS